MKLEDTDRIEKVFLTLDTMNPEVGIHLLNQLRKVRLNQMSRDRRFIAKVLLANLAFAVLTGFATYFVAMGVR